MVGLCSCSVTSYNVCFFSLVAVHFSALDLFQLAGLGDSTSIQKNLKKKSLKYTTFHWNL
jgi:hypothetical protein